MTGYQHDNFLMLVVSSVVDLYILPTDPDPAFLATSGSRSGLLWQTEKFSKLFFIPPWLYFIFLLSMKIVLQKIKKFRLRSDLKLPDPDPGEAKLHRSYRLRIHTMFHCQRYN